MCAYYSTRVFCAALISWVMACGGDLTLPAGTPALRAFSGNGQEGPVGTELPEPLVVKLTDGASNPVAGVALEFRFQDQVPDARVEPSTRETDDSGFASVRVRLGNTVGPQTVEASVADGTASDLRTIFGLTALEDDGDGDGGGGGGRGRGGSDADD
jgi:hypothetical protein